HAVEIVLHQHAVGRELPIDGGDDHVAVAGEVGGEAVDVAALGGEVQLVQHGLGQLGDQGARAIAGDLGAGLFGAADQFGDQAQVGLDARAHAGAADLDHHLGPVVQGGAVHLGDGGGGQRRRVETGEDLFRRPAQGGFDLGPQRLEVEGRSSALELFELGDPVGGQQVRAGGQDLAQLDEGGAQRLQRLTGAA